MIAMKTIRYLALAVSLMPAAMCRAASPDGYDLLPVLDSPMRWGAVGVGLVFLFVISVVGFKQSKRTHLD